MLQAFMDLRILHQVFDSAQRDLEREIGVPVCVENCGLCCRENCPSCMLIEGANMVSTLTGEGKLGKALALAEGWLLEKHPEASIYRGLPVGLVPQDVRGEWAALSKTRCPFLTEGLRCFLHTCRPLVCRAYGVTRDQEGCPRPLGKNESSSSRGIIDSGELRWLVQEFKNRCSARQPEWTIRCFAAAALFRAVRPKEFRAYVDDNRIASAKIIGTEMDFALMWQPQLEALRAGQPPDLVAYAFNAPDAERMLSIF